MTEIEKFLFRFNRMCGYYDVCSDCELRRRTEKSPCFVADYKIILEAIEEFEKNHPLETRFTDLKKKYPNFKLSDNGYPAFLPRVFGYCGERVDCGGCENCGLGGEVCWNQPL